MMEASHVPQTDTSNGLISESLVHGKIKLDLHWRQQQSRCQRSVRGQSFGHSKHFYTTGFAFSHSHTHTHRDSYTLGSDHITGVLLLIRSIDYFNHSHTSAASADILGLNVLFKDTSAY